MDAYTRYLRRWSKLADQTNATEKADSYYGAAEDFEAHIVNAVNGSTIKEPSPVLRQEYARIFSLSVRRFRALITCARLAYHDVVIDELRALMELMFQCFYLARSADAEKAASDAINLSAISEEKKRKELVEIGEIVLDPLTPEQTEAKAMVLESVFPQYCGRKPKFYADLSVRKTAELAGLERVHTLLYSAFSSHLHSEPIRQLVSFTHRGEDLVITLWPSDHALDTLWGEVSIATQVFVLTSLMALCSFSKADIDVINEILDMFKLHYPDHGWNEEIELIHNLASK